MPRPKSVPQKQKRCCHCKEIKLLSEFYPSSTGKWGRYNYCKICTNELRKTPKERERARLATKKRREDPKEERKHVDAERARRYKNDYGITVEEYEKMLEEQGGVCAVCERPPKTKRLSVDHEHQKNEKNKSPESKRVRVRGLLCHRCNRALGILGNSTQDLLFFTENLANYMVRYYSKRMADTLGAEEALRRAENAVKYLEDFEKRKPK